MGNAPWGTGFRRSHEHAGLLCARVRGRSLNTVISQAALSIDRTRAWTVSDVVLACVRAATAFVLVPSFWKRLASMGLPRWDGGHMRGTRWPHHQRPETPGCLNPHDDSRREADGELAYGAHESRHRIVARSLLKQATGASTHALCAVLTVAGAPR